jgi:hypothetical protein
VTAYLRGTALDDEALLANVGPGLAAGADLAPIAAAAWNAFAVQLGVRLVVAMELGERERTAAAQALAAISDLPALLASERPELAVGMIDATLRPLLMMAGGGPGTALFRRIFAWGVRRATRDRRLADSLADLATAAAETLGELAELAGRSAADAIAAERATQLADARAILA